MLYIAVLEAHVVIKILSPYFQRSFTNSCAKEETLWLIFSKLVTDVELRMMLGVLDGLDAH